MKEFAGGEYMHRLRNEPAAALDKFTRAAPPWARRISVTLACLSFAVPSLACAADIEVQVSDQRGRAVADAVVTIQADALPASEDSASVIHYVDQKNETFIPYVQVFRPGDSVVFRNGDRTRHHVYSFSDVKSFQYLIRAGHQGSPIQIDKPGIVPVGCNIHDHMIMYLFVTAAPRVALSGQDGNATLIDLPSGTYTAEVWHPRLRPGEPPVSQQVVVNNADGTATIKFILSLLPDRRLSVDRQHLPY